MLSYFRGRWFLLVVVMITTVLGVGAYMTPKLRWKTQLNQSQTPEQKQQQKEAFHARVREGIGKEFQQGNSLDLPSYARASVEAVANFTARRSGIKLSPQVRKRLALMEEALLLGNSRRITPEELSDILAETAVERISSLTNSEIDNGAETLRGFGSADANPQTRCCIRLRANRIGGIKPDAFAAQVKDFRDGLNSNSAALLRKGIVLSAIQPIVGDRVGFLSASLPNRFGGVQNVGLTPLESFVIAYSAASDDLMTDSDVNLQKMMKGLERNMTKELGYHPSSENRTAYGVNGYLYSTPLDLIFNEATVNSLLDRIEEKGSGIK